MKLNKIMKPFVILSMAVLTFTACTEVKPDKTEPTEQVEATQSPDPVMTKSEEPSDGPMENVVPDSGYEFTLSEEEQVLYDEFKEKKDMNVFKDAKPISIAKVHLMYGVRGEWEAEYEMFYKEDLSITKEKYEETFINESKRVVQEEKQSLANWYFALIDEGKFVEDGNKGIISFQSVKTTEEDTEEDLAVTFTMIKDSDGLWWIREYPTLGEDYK